MRNHKKDDGLLRKRSKIVRYRFIDAQKTHYPIAVLCDVMKVSRSRFYAWKERPTKSNALLKVTIKSNMKRVMEYIVLLVLHKR